MIDTIKGKLNEWRHNLDHLQQDRAQLAQRLAEIDANILRHQGAIMAADELLKAAPQVDEDEDGTPAVLHVA